MDDDERCTMFSTTTDSPDCAQTGSDRAVDCGWSAAPHRSTRARRKHYHSDLAIWLLTFIRYTRLSLVRAGGTFPPINVRSATAAGFSSATTAKALKGERPRRNPRAGSGRRDRRAREREIEAGRIDKGIGSGRHRSKNRKVQGRRATKKTKRLRTARRRGGRTKTGDGCLSFF